MAMAGRSTKQHLTNYNYGDDAGKTRKRRMPGIKRIN
jgi:hypothetical protein